MSDNSGDFFTKYVIPFLVALLVFLFLFGLVGVFTKPIPQEPKYTGPIVTCEQLITKMPVSNWHHSQDDKWIFINADKTKIYQTDFHCIIEDQYSAAK